jgi:hypothetical protein
MGGGRFAHGIHSSGRISGTVPEPNTDFSQRGSQTLARLWPMLAVLPFAVLAWAHWSDAPSILASDYAQYLLHAKAIAEGRAYGDVGYIFTEYNPLIGPRVQPPGWPLILAPFVAVFGTALLVPKILVTLATCAFLCVAALRISRDDSRAVAMLSAAICGVALESDFAINTPLSDLPFAAFLWGLILFVDSEAPLSWRRASIVWLAGILVMSVRVLGVALVPGLFLLAILRRRDRAQLLAIASAWVAVGLILLLAVGVDQIPFLGMVVRAPIKMLPQMSDVMRYRYSLFQSLMYPMPWDRANDAYHLVAPLLVVPGLVEFARRFGRSAAGCVAVSIIGVLSVAPVSDGRYLWAIWPILAYSFVAGARFWVERMTIPIARRPRLLTGAVGFLIVSAVLTAFGKPSYPSFADNRGFVGVVEWVRTESRVAPLRVAFFSPRVLTLETGVPAMPWFAGSPEVTVAELREARITHVILGEFGVAGRALRSMEGTIRSRPTAFELVHSDEHFSVYRFIAPPSDSGATESRESGS